MNWHSVRLDEVFPTPWRNGGGTARELLAWPHREDWHVRVSLADIERDGPFSSYPGVARWFAVASGAGVKLRVDGNGHSLKPGSAPFRFDGGARVECDLLAGPDLGKRPVLRIVEIDGQRLAVGGEEVLLLAHASMMMILN